MFLASAAATEVNIGGETICTSRNIPFRYFGKHLPPFSDKTRDLLTSKLFNAEVINDSPLHTYLNSKKFIADHATLLFKE